MTEPTLKKMVFVVDITFDRPVVKKAKPRGRHVRIGTATCTGTVEVEIDIGEIARRVGGKALSFKRGRYSVLHGAIRAVAKGEPVEIEVKLSAPGS